MTEQRNSTKHGALRDDVLKADTEQMEHGADSRAEEWRQPEELREESAQPVAAPANDPHATGGTPAGMDAADVRGRSELARWLQPAAFPADRERLLRSAEDTTAPDWVTETLQTLPDDQRYENMQDLWRALGGGTEDVTHRS